MKIKQLLNESTDKQNIIEVKFKEISVFRKAHNILVKNKWYKNGNGNIPSSEQIKNKMIFDLDERWLTISSANKEVIRLLMKNGIDKNDISIEKKKPMKYKIFNHGGHLD